MICTNSRWFLHHPLSLVAFCDRDHDKTPSGDNLWRKELIWPTGDSPSLMEPRAGTQGKNLKRNQRTNGAYWPASSGLLSYLSYTALAHLPQNWTVHTVLDLPIINPHHSRAVKSNLREAIPQLSSPFPSMSSAQPRLAITLS